jgi:predicted dehydrogenase
VSRVSAFAATRSHRGIEVEDVAVVSLQFRSGALGVIEGTTGAWPGERLRIEVNGDRGSVTLEDETVTRWQFERELPEDEEIGRLMDGPGALSNGATDPRAIDSEGHRRQFEDFLRAIRENRKPAVEGSEARSAVAIITAAYRSAREGRAVHIDSL